MVESLIENIQREDLTSMETAKFIKKIWNGIGNPVHEKGEFKGQPAYFLLEEAIGMKADRIAEHLFLIADKTPKEVKKAVEEGKLAMRSASMIKQLPEEKQLRNSSTSSLIILRMLYMVKISKEKGVLSSEMG